jgi:hypothetical protein
VRNAPGAICVLASAALDPLRKIKKEAPGLLAGTPRYDPTPFVAAFVRVMMYVPEFPKGDELLPPREPVSVDAAIAFFQRVFLWGRPHGGANAPQGIDTDISETPALREIKVAKKGRRDWPGLGDFLLKHMAQIEAAGKAVEWKTIAKDYARERGLNPAPPGNTCRTTYYRLRKRDAASSDDRHGENRAR